MIRGGNVSLPVLTSSCIDIPASAHLWQEPECLREDMLGRPYLALARILVHHPTFIPDAIRLHRNSLPKEWWSQLATAHQYTVDLFRSEVRRIQIRVIFSCCWRNRLYNYIHVDRTLYMCVNLYFIYTVRLIYLYDMQIRQGTPKFHWPGAHWSLESLADI